MAEEIYGSHYYENTETFNNQKRHLGIKLYRRVAVSIGLLCILLTALNFAFRLSFKCSGDFDSMLKNATVERDELKEKITSFDKYSSQGWIYFNNSFYYISSIKKSWQDSRNDCLQRGADLVVINSKAEQEFTRQFKQLIWIGLTDREREGTWTWVDGTPLTMSYWGINEPNSHKGGDEDCGEIKFFDHENSWNDKPCYIKNVWMCEKTTPL